MLGQQIETRNGKAKRHIGRQQANERPRNPALTRGSGRYILAQKFILGCWRPALPVVDTAFFVARVHCLLLICQTGASKTALPSPDWRGRVGRLCSAVGHSPHDKLHGANNAPEIRGGSVEQEHEDSKMRQSSATVNRGQNFMLGTRFPHDQHSLHTFSHRPTAA